MRASTDGKGSVHPVDAGTELHADGICAGSGDGGVDGILEGGIRGLSFGGDDGDLVSAFFFTASRHQE